MQSSTIEWTEQTWNPSIGCDKVSAGCKNCYAESIAERFRDGKAFPNGFDFMLRPKRFEQPLHWRKPSLIFVNSMSDLFHEHMPLEVLQKLFDIMRQCPQHIFQILTKRHQRLVEIASELTWHDNIWMGVSIENQDCAVRADYLRQVPAKMRFLSCEPLLGPVKIDLAGISWVIVGGESGSRYRPFDIEWARDIRDQCRQAGASYFLKQLGGHPEKRHKLSDFPEDLRIREMPHNREPAGSQEPAVFLAWTSERRTTVMSDVSKQTTAIFGGNIKRSSPPNT
jgi:protein gp37